MYPPGIYEALEGKQQILRERSKKKKEKAAKVIQRKQRSRMKKKSSKKSRSRSRSRSRSSSRSRKRSKSRPRSRSRQRSRSRPRSRSRQRSSSTSGQLSRTGQRRKKKYTPQELENKRLILKHAKMELDRLKKLREQRGEEMFVYPGRSIALPKSYFDEEGRVMFNNQGEFIPESSRLVRQQRKSEAQILKESIPPSRM